MFQLLPELNPNPAQALRSVNIKLYGIKVPLQIMKSSLSDKNKSDRS